MSDAPEGGTESTGGGLRAQLEAALADKKALQQAHIETLTSQFRHVKPEDFVGISANQYASHAAQVEQARIAERDSLLREALVAKGVPDGDLDSVLSQLKASQTSNDSPASRTASLGGLGGAPATFEGKSPETAREFIMAGLRQAEKNKK